MKKTISLNIEYLDLKAKKISATEEVILRKNLLKKAIRQFKDQMKDSFDSNSIKILYEHMPNEIIVEYNNFEADVIYNKLLKSEVVEVIDAQVYDYNE